MKTIFTALYLFLFSAFAAFAQDLESTLNRYGSEFGQERTYLQYDKSTYAAGETVWFKAYIMEGIYPSERSKNFYVDWTDDKGNLLYHTISPVQGGVTNGQYEIPANYKGKFIHVKAYTKWMLNFDTAFLYEKDLLVLSKNTTSGDAKVNLPPTIVFFPEGGDMIAGVSGKLAFKATDQWGRPVKIRGAIRDQAGKLVDSLRELHDGMGHVVFTPAPGEKYTAKWKDEKGAEYNSALPEVKDNGIGLQVMVMGTRRKFTVTANSNSGNDSVHIVGTLNQFQAFRVTKDIKSGSASGIIPTDNIPSGILVITVFDKQWNPLAERITFINNDEYRFNAHVEVEKWGLNKRAKNELVLVVPDSLSANFSVSVTDAGIDTDSSNNIISHLLLSSDIRGQVYNPWYYFSGKNDTLSQHLDLVMLTNGWRRFNWNDITKGKFPRLVFPKDSTYLTLSGRVYGVTPTQLRDKAHVILVVNQKEKGEGNKILFIPVEMDGQFSDPSIILFDTANIYFQLSKSIRDATVKFMESRLPALKTRLSASGSFYNQLGDTTGFARHFQLSDETLQILKAYEGKVLENVTIKARTKTPIQVLDEKYASGMFSGVNGYQFDLINDNTLASASPNIFTFLQSKVPGLNITVAGTSANLQWRGGTPLLFLDEIPAEANFLSTIAVSDVAYIKVFRPPFFGAPGGSAGAIAVYTRRGGDVASIPGEGLSSSTVSGYSMIREFYSPNYATFNAANEKRDLRTTLYWHPQLITTRGNNKVQFSFYNNDVSKSFRVVIEGMARDGRLVRIEQVLE